MLYVRNDGLIYKHVVQRVQPDSDKELDVDTNRLKNLQLQNMDVSPSIFSKNDKML
jgi:hypothetical protein